MNMKAILLTLIILTCFVGVSMAAHPDPVNLTSDTGAIWVRWDWNAGTGNVTDSYNISILRCGDTDSSDVVWVNGTTNTYVRFTTTTTPKICAGDATIKIYAYNTTYNELSGSVTDTVTIPMMFASIVNLISAIVPLFTSILDLIVAVFPLVIAMAFFVGLALLINKIFDKSLNFGKRK